MASLDSQDKLLRKLRSWVDDATQDLRDLHTKWDEYGLFYQGVQDEGVGLKADDYNDWAPVNLIFSTIETCIPILADAAPLWYAKGLTDDADEDQERQLTDALQGVWYSRRVARQYKMALRDQLLRGTGFLKVWWNPNIGPTQLDVDDRGRAISRRLGDIDVSWLDPYSVYPDPAARSLDECEWLALANDIVPERAKRIWDKFDETKAQLMEDDTERPTSWLSRALAWVFGLGDTARTGDRKTYRVWEMYHDGGRRLTVFSGNQVLWDGPNPTPGEAFPIAAFPMCERGESFWGIPITAQIKQLQTKINKQHMMLHQHLRLLGRTTIVTNDSAAAQKITANGARPGLVIQVKGPDGFAKPLDPPQLPSWVFAYLREMYEDVKTVTGVQDVVRGLRPGSVQSGIGIQQLQESALTRLRDISRDNALQLERCGQIVTEFMQEKYREDRSFAYQRGSDMVRGTLPLDALSEERTSPEMAADAIMGDEESFILGEGAPAVETMRVPRAIRVVVEAGNSLPLNSMAEAELALRLYQLRDAQGQPPIDEEALLDAVKFGRRKEVLERRRERADAMMQGQMAAQQTAGPMGAAGMASAAPGPAGPPVQAGIGPVPQQDVAGALQALLAPILEVLGPEDQQVLIGIVQALLQGQQLTAEQIAWLEALPPELQQMLEQALQAIGMNVGAETPGPNVPAADGPVGLI